MIVSKLGIDCDAPDLKRVVVSPDLNIRSKP